DVAIITTAVPKIIDEFHSIADVGRQLAKLCNSRLASSMSQPLQGRVFDYSSVKWAFLIYLIIFGQGALLSGAAPSSTVFIAGHVEELFVSYANLGSCINFPAAFGRKPHIYIISDSLVSNLSRRKKRLTRGK
ncbi:Efflux pump mlcE, partial [Talaromyces pinophilus]